MLYIHRPYCRELLYSHLSTKPFHSEVVLRLFRTLQQCAIRALSVPMIGGLNYPPRSTSPFRSPGHCQGTSLSPPPLVELFVFRSTEQRHAPKPHHTLGPVGDCNSRYPPDFAIESDCLTALFYFPQRKQFLTYESG